MAKFMDVHEGFFGVSQTDVEGAHEADLAVQSEEGVQFEKWWADPTSGKVFCLSSGPNMDAVKRVHSKAGHPTEQVWEVSLSGE